MHKRNYYLVNGITLYRILAAPFLIYLIFYHKPDLFKWLLALSFFTDMIDGYLARKFKVISVLGARLDSIADDLTIVAAVTGIFILKPEFIREQVNVVIILCVFYAIQNIAALARYRKVSSFHTYLAKVAAVLQGAFLILVFFLPSPIYSLFYFTCLATALDLLEEIILVFVLPKWEPDVKGLFWVLKRKQVKSF